MVFRSKRLLENLHSEPDLMEPTANFREGSPIYTDHPKLHARYSEPARERLAGYLASLLGKLPDISDLTVGIRKLPTYVDRAVEGGREVIKSVSKVFGVYNPSTKEAYFDPVLYKELGDPERELLQRRGLKIPTPERVAAEEFAHHIQSKEGYISRFLRKYGDAARGYIEGAAAAVSDKIFGETTVYSAWKDRFRKIASRFGEKAAFQGAY